MLRKISVPALFALLVFLVAPLSAELPKIERDVVYGTVGDLKLLADVYSPAEESDEPRPVVLLIHGGGWRGGNKTAGAEVALGNALANRGFVAVSISYRLVKDAGNGKFVNQWPAAIDDCRQAVCWIRENAEKLNVDATKMGAAGDSAGGHLVSLLGTTDAAKEGETSTRVQAVVNIYGPGDLTKDWTKYEIKANVAVQGMIDNFLGKGNEENQKAASPTLHVDDESASFLILQGGEDQLVPPEQTKALHDALTKAGSFSEFVLYEKDGHGFGPNTALRALAKSIEFFERELKAVPATN
ncbi:alpha/beta hydrolase [Blastopirellula sp. JC732]|uniref:Alpha/beta hydrolase n=1 Tax=Blastopirellula sediminis TaxID=2894196 RepID=A0A9X1SGB7_9BACT|nr:alpha/beta hydrolase [Blastopirellula sediminis]MCC9608712.1 alpha/beta hydrolase [Blastopirellula sediminis]MCC9628511.1 alpha/beta hydrolase [Blastopirellula sediminis]